MYLHGTFLTNNGETVTVEILTKRNPIPDIEIGQSSGMVFTDDPVDITSEVNDTFDPLFRSSASIRLLTRGLISDLYCESVMDAVVNITRNGECVFAGYVVPQSYNQSFSEVYDEIEINCIDAISALQYGQYKEIGSSGVDYNSLRTEADMTTFRDLIEEMLGSVTQSLDLSGENRCRVLYDGSITIDTENPVFEDISVSELLFMGSEEDEAWSKQEILEEIARYLDLHIVQKGLDFYIYSLSTVKASGAEIEWVTLDGEAAAVTERKTIAITTEVAMDADANITIGEVYNRLELTCDITEMESLIESPLDSENISSPYTNKQLYVREYALERYGPNDAILLIPVFKDLVNNGVYSKKYKCSITDWYIQVRSNPQWRFLSRGGYDLYATYCSTGRYQQGLPIYLGGSLGAALVSFGKVEHVYDLKDNSLTGKVSMEDSLVVCVNGNGKESQAYIYPSEEDLVNACPVAEYTGAISGGIFSPSDEDTVNYIVFSGKIVLNPRLEQSFPHHQAPWLPPYTWPELDSAPDSYYMGNTASVPSKSMKKGKVYCTQWFGAEYPNSEPYYVTGPGLMPFTGDTPEQYEFKYSAIGDSNDTISKIGVLACMLIIGDKCAVESQDSNGQITDFQWLPYKTREECEDDDEYYAQSFTLGFDPKIGDKLIGTEYELQNNIDHRLGLDMEGTAIPIRKSDKLRGKVTFRILGPVNTVWDEVTRRHRTWFRSVKWGSKSVPLLAHIQNIIIKDFEVTINSDNGLINNTDDCDLVYISDTDEKFVNIKDDLDFRITTALTTEERKSMGISDSLKLSSPVIASTGEPLLEIHNTVTGNIGKPERLYVDGFYREYHKPRITLTHKLRTNPEKVGQFNRYTHPALGGKVFFVEGISSNLMRGSDELTLKEIEAND